MHPAIGIVACGALLAAAYLLRAIPGWLSPHGLGVDHWFWKGYIQEYRRNRRFPPVLPQYVLDEAQWYPPAFPLLMAALPTAIFERYSSQIAILIDLARMVLLLAVASWQTDGNWTVILIAGAVYATTPIQISYNVQLNPRGVGAIMLDALLMGLLWIRQAGPPSAHVAVLLLGGLILLTHKMTTQLLWFLLLGTAAIYRRWEILLLIPATIAVAIVISRGFYINVLRAHWDIVSFWARNWRWIGADPIRESPIYGNGRYERPKKLHKSGMRGVLWHCFILFGFNPAAWISCLLIYERLFVESAMLIYPTPILVWVLLTCAFACLTAFVPVLKCIGPGYLYVYNTSLLVSLVLGLTFEFTKAPQLSTTLIMLAMGLNLVGVALYYRQVLRDKRTRVDDDLKTMLGELRDLPRGVVMCIPSHWSEVVAYKTGQAVLWGAHGYGFRRLEPTWPRLLLPIREIVRRYGVRYLLTMDEMVVPVFEADLQPATEIRHGEYRLYCFRIAEDAAVGEDGTVVPVIPTAT